MFFALSKTLAFVLTPSNLLLLIALAGLALLRRGKKRLGGSLLVAAVVSLAIAGWSPLGPILLMSLEDRFPKPDFPTSVAGVVMLGGAVDIHITEARGSETWNEQAERITTTAELANKYPSARIVLSGGAGLVTGRPGEITESSVARQSLTAMGVPEGRIEIEERSRNTCENAIESAKTAKPKTGEIWLLVTSASHMPRAVACFRAAKFGVVPYPVDYRTLGGSELWTVRESLVEGLADFDLATHEWIGLVTYRIVGMTDELFPAP